MSSVTLSAIAEINPPSPVSLAEDEPVSFLPMAAVANDGGGFRPEARSYGEVSKGYTPFASGDVLLAKITPCFENGKVAYIDRLPHRVGYGSTEFHVLRPHDDLDGRYLFHLLRSPRFRLDGEARMTGSGGQRRVPAQFLRDYELPRPLLTEQKRIATILDKADAIRAKRRAALEDTDALLRATFLELFGDPVANPKGWDAAALSDGIDEIEAGWSASGEDRPRVAGEKAVLKVSAVTWERFDPQAAKVVVEIPNDQALITPKHGDVLFSRANTRELVAATVLVSGDHADVFLPDKLWRIRTNSRLRPEYLRYLLAMPRLRAALCKRATGSSGSMLNISQAKLREQIVPFPPVAMQEKFGAVVWAIYQAEDRMQQALADAEALYASLARRAFRGEL